jgi:hypothetical protein
MRRFVVLLVAGLPACQIILGFEDHEPFPGSGGASSTSTQSGASSTGASQGGGGAGGFVFGQPELVGSAAVPLTDIVVDGPEVYALSPSAGQILRFTEGNMTPTVVVSGLVDARGLARDGDHLLTTACDGATECAALRIHESGNPSESVVVETSETTNNVFRGVAGAGGLVGITRVGDPQTGFDSVRRGMAGSPGPGTLIGKNAPDGGASDLGAVAVDGTSYLWIDPSQQLVYRSDGTAINPNPMAPGTGVVTVASGLAEPVDLVVRAGSVYVLSPAGVGMAPSGGRGAAFEMLTTTTGNAPSGLSVDSSHAYWVSGARVRAAPYGSATGLLDEDLGAGALADTASRDDALFVASAGGSVYRIPKNLAR